jgi:hypothetical protein
MLLMQSYFVILSSTFLSRIYESISFFRFLLFVFAFPTSDKVPQVGSFWDCCDIKEFNYITVENKRGKLCELNC